MNTIRILERIKNTAKKAHTVYMFAFMLIPTISLAIEIKPSFNCEKAQTEIEKTICEDKDIALLDMYMSDLYQTILDMGVNSEIRADQINWIKNVRNRSCIQGSKLGEKLNKQLSNCYYDRIRELQGYSAIGKNFQKKYFEIILSQGEFTDPKSISDPAEKYVAEIHLQNAFNNMVIDTNNISPKILYWDKKFLILHYYGSSYGGGSSIVYNNRVKLCYSELSKKFIPSSYWSCHDKKSEADAISSTLDAVKGIIEKLNVSLDKMDILKSFMSYPQLAMNDDILYSQKAIDFAKNNTTVIFAVLNMNRDKSIVILSDMDNVYRNIVSSQDWSQKIVAGSYDDGYNSGYQFISDNFPALPKEYDEKFGEGIVYTYGEFYYRIWKKLHTNRTMDDAHETIATLLKSLNN